MNIELLFESKIVTDLGWTLLHSLWQIGLIAGALFIALRVLRNASANFRYAVALGSIVLVVVLPVATFIQFSGESVAGFASEKFSETWAQNSVDERNSSDRTGSTAISKSGSNIEATRSPGFLSDARVYFSQNISDILPFVVGLWLMGMAIFSLRLGGGLWQLRTYKNSSDDGLDDMRRRAFEAICKRVGLERAVRFISSTAVETPIAIGIFKPVIIIPAALFMQISPRELETIIAHELIHIRHFDPLINAAQCLVEVLFFYHPAMWWMSSVVRREREFAADAAVLEIFSNSHVTYARALANLEELRSMAKRQMPRVATAANGGNLMLRMQKILNVKTEANRTSSAWTAGMALLLTSALLAVLFSASSAPAVNAGPNPGMKKIAVGFVSIPPTDRTANPPLDADATARLLIEKLKSHKVPAIGFVQGGMISDGEKMFPVRANIVRLWRDAGFEIGIGGFKHIWFSNTAYDDYVANVEKNEMVVKKILDEKGQKIRYFSYPFLNNGGNREDKVKFEGWLKDRGYQFIPYTFDNDEWLYSFAYDAARNDNDLNTMRMVREEFVSYMQKMLAYCESYSQDMFQRDIAQTMVLTPSRLVADTADELFGSFAKRGYTFVSMDEALADEAYKTPENLVISGSGISWFKRWGAKSGKTLPGEPKVNEDVAAIWKKAEKKK